MNRVFLRAHAAEMIDVFDALIFWERHGDPTACAILAALDAEYAAKGTPPDCGLIITLAVKHGWFDHDTKHPLSWAGKCEHE